MRVVKLTQHAITGEYGKSLWADTSSSIAIRKSCAGFRMRMQQDFASYHMPLIMKEALGAIKKAAKAMSQEISIIRLH